MNRFLIILFMISALTSLGQTTWKSVDDIPKKWIMVERDSLGYLVYKPCSGGTPMITIDSVYITIYWRLDAPSKLAIDKFTLQKGNKSFYINAAEEHGNIKFTALLKDDKQKLVLWGFADFKWVMTPYEYKDKFRQMDNPCPTEMKHEKQFLPVEF